MNISDLKLKLTALESIQESSNPNSLEKHVQMIADKIENCREDIRSAIELWLLNGQETKIEVCGINYFDLLSKAKMTPLAAYLTLDWVYREPEQAVASLKTEYML